MDASVDCSVVIVSWNTRELLAACLASIPRGGRSRLEVIVVDNGSEDGSAEMAAERFPWIRLIRNRDNRGFAAANNQGFAIARGRHVLLLNSDTEIRDPGTLDRCVDWLDARPDAAVLGGRVTNPDGTTQLTCFRDPGLLDLALLATGLHRLRRPAWLARLAGRQRMLGWARDDERDVDVVTGCHMLVRRSAMDAVGMLDEAFFFYGEEADWCRRFRAAGWRVVFSPLGDVMHHGGASALRISGEAGLMLARAIVRLVRTHDGRLAGLAAWTILLASHLWRALAFGVAGACTLDRGRLRRARRAAAIAGRFGGAWPAVR